VEEKQEEEQTFDMLMEKLSKGLNERVEVLYKINDEEKPSQEQVEEEERQKNPFLNFKLNTEELIKMFEQK